VPDLQPEAFGDFFQCRPDQWTEKLAKPLCVAHWRHPDFYVNVGDPGNPDPVWRKPMTEYEFVCFVADEGCASVFNSITGCYFRVVAFKYGGKVVNVKARHENNDEARNKKFGQALVRAKKLLESMQIL
jgi:hypothetical protein